MQLWYCSFQVLVVVVVVGHIMMTHHEVLVARFPSEQPKLIKGAAIKRPSVVASPQEIPCLFEYI
jgi:hypothetical protein